MLRVCRWAQFDFDRQCDCCRPIDTRAIIESGAKPQSAHDDLRACPNHAVEMLDVLIAHADTAGGGGRADA